MDGWRVAHLILLGLWGGVVFAELVLELSPRTDAERRLVARIHYWTDVTIELPLLAGVVITGIVLTSRVENRTTLHWVKLGLALAAIASNVLAAVVVFRRRRTDDPAALERLGRAVRLSGLGVPFGLAALYIGLAHFHAW